MSTNNSEKKVDNKKRLLGFAAAGLLALAAIVVCSILQSLNISGFVWLYQLIIIIACVAGIYFIIRNFIYEYSYTFSKDHFIIHQLVGSRDNVLFAVAYDDILGYAPLSTLKADPEKIKKLDKFYVPSSNLEIFYLKYHDINADCDKILTFKPSAAVLDKLSEKTA